MGKKDKLIARFETQPNDFTWNELCTLLKSLGYVQIKKGKTGGSRVGFIHTECPPINLHKPHPGKILKAYQMREILSMLYREKLL